jgi:hypothetical protein
MRKHHVVRRQAGHPLPTAIALLVTMLLGLMLVACASGSSVSPTVRAVTPTVFAAATRTEADALARIHNVSPRDFMLFVSVRFTSETTFSQAMAILRGHVYPWTCDEPATPTPPSEAEQQSAFAASHTLVISYPAWDELVRIARSAQVVSVDADPLYPCP